MMKDPFTLYEAGLRQLMKEMGQAHPRLPEAIALQAHLLESMAATRRYGESETSRAERSKILDGLNRLTVETLGTSLNELATYSQVVELREQIQRLESLRQVLGDVLTEQKKAELEAQLRPLLETSGGAVVAGDVRTGGGAFVGRDQIVSVMDDRAVIIGGDVRGVSVATGDGQTVILAPDQLSIESLMRAYYRSLLVECGRLPLGLVDPKLVSPFHGIEFSIPDVYVALNVVCPNPTEDESERAWGPRLARGEGQGCTPLLQAIAEPDTYRLVLVGDPGSGKTTFVNYVTYLLSSVFLTEAGPPVPETLQDLLPVRLLLRTSAVHIPIDTDRGTARMLWDALRSDIAERLGEAAAEHLFPHLQNRVMESGVFLLDGLDEVPEAGQRRKCLVEAIQELAEGLPRARILLTTRPYAYADPSCQLLGFPVLALAPFDESQVRHFVQSWYQAMSPAMGWDAVTTQVRSQDLAQALRNRPCLADLASRPMMLTLMATLHSSWGQLPEDRADLYEESIRLLLSRWERGRQVQGPDGRPILEPGIEPALGLGEHRIRAALEKLAYQTHMRQGSELERGDLPDDIPLGDLLNVFTSLLPADVDPAVLLSYLYRRAGLLIGRREGVYSFVHRSFQEYLAACYLVQRLDCVEALSSHVKMDPIHWGEVFLLAVGHLRQAGLGMALSAIAHLLPEDPKQVPQKTSLEWRIALLASRAILDVAPSSVSFLEGAYAALLVRVRRWLECLIRIPHALPDNELEAAYEIAGQLLPQDTPEKPLALGRLGDIRYARYISTSSLANLETAVIAYRQAVELASVYDPERPAWLDSLATALLSLYKARGDVDHLQEGIELYHKVLPLVTADPAFRVAILRKLGRALCDLYRETNTGVHLDAAIIAYEDAISETMDLPSSQTLRAELTAILRLHTQQPFFSLWDGVQPEDKKERIQRFCELLSTVAGVPLLDFRVLPDEKLFFAILDLGAIFQEIPMSSADRFPILFLDSCLSNDALEHIRQTLSNRLGPSNRRALLVPLSNAEALAGARDLLSGAMRQAHAYDIICLSRDDLGRIVVDAEPRNALRHALLSRADLSRIPAYKTSGPTPDNAFFGRENELQEICDHAGSANYVLIGGRRIGKTSILKRLERIRLPAAGFCALYHGCSFTPTQGDLIKALATDKSWFPDPPADLPASFAGILQILPSDRPLVILLDEADKLIAPDRAAGYPLFNALRDLANAGRCRFVLSGERVLRAELTNPRSPLANFGDEMLVGRLGFRAVEELITRPMKKLEIELLDEAAMVQRIWDFSSGHPNVVQRLCQRLILRLNQRKDRRLTLDDVEAIVADANFLRKDFLNVYWERATTLERLCSLVMAASENTRTLMAVREALTEHGLEVNLSQVDDALERLVDLRNILERTAEGYEFSVTSFPRVIGKTARLGDLIALDCERYRRQGDVEPRTEGGGS